MFKRIGLLVLANLAVFIMLSVVLTIVQMVFGVNFGGMAGADLLDGRGLHGLDHLASDVEDDGEDVDGSADD